MTGFSDDDRIAPLLSSPTLQKVGDRINWASSLVQLFCTLSLTLPHEVSGGGDRKRRPDNFRFPSRSVPFPFLSLSPPPFFVMGEGEGEVADFLRPCTS